MALSCGCGCVEHILMLIVVEVESCRMILAYGLRLTFRVELRDLEMSKLRWSICSLTRLGLEVWKVGLWSVQR